MFTGAIFVPMFTIVTLGQYTHKKQSETFHAKPILKVKFWEENVFDKHKQKWL